MTFEQLFDILGYPSKKLTKTELCQVLRELKQDCTNEGHRVFDQDDAHKYQYYMGMVNAFYICLDLLEHLEADNNDNTTTN